MALFSHCLSMWQTVITIYVWKPAWFLSKLFKHLFSESTSDGAGCWHEPIYNYTLVEVDLQIPNIDIEQVSYQKLRMPN